MTLRGPRTLMLATATSLAVSAVVVAASPPPASADPGVVTSVVVDGRGFGHGYGMSQWGAYGWATQHGKTWQEILTFYYGGTSISDVRDSDYTAAPVGRVTVQLTASDDRQTSLVSDSGALTTVADPGPPPPPPTDPPVEPPPPTGPRSWSSIVAREVPGRHNVYAVWGHSERRCPAASDPLADTDGWVLLNSEAPGPVNVTTPNGESDSAAIPGDLIGVCEPSGNVRYYRGLVRAVNTTSGLDRTVNEMRLEHYVRGVVPRESSASWGNAAGGAGANALRAQAVAARSYAVIPGARSTVYKLCDTTSCQVYGGAALRTGGLGASAKTLEDPRTNDAVAVTAGKVMRHASGKVANTMYASSNGGRTIGATFPAVDDLGDAVANNPHHSWSVTLSASAITNAWPSIGALLDIQVTERTGGGTWGGWIVKLVLKGSAKNLTLSGDDFRRALGLKSRYLNFTLVRAAPTQPPGPGLFIGDGVGSATKSSIAKLVKGVYAVSYSTRSSRCTVPRKGCTKNTALSVINGLTTVPAYVVMQLGYNDAPSKFGATIDAAMQALTAKGVQRVVWINLSERRLNKQGASVFAPANAALRDAALRWPQLVVLDWNAASSGSDATKWFNKGSRSRPNWTTLTSTGRSRFALFVRSQLDQLAGMGVLPSAPGGPPPTTTPPGTDPPPTSDPPTSEPPVVRPTLKKGDSGSFVLELQNLLREWGSTITADAQFGSLTEAAVKAFQTAKGLAADGIVGASTWAALLS